MVRQVKKILILCAAMILLAGITGTVSAATVYDGNLSSTYTTYFLDILPNLKITDNYVYFRSGQYDYTLVAGDLEYNNGSFKLVGNTAKEYVISTSSNSYNNYYTYTVNDISSFTLNPSNKIVYSDLGDYPQLEERGQQHEIYQTVLLCIFGLCVLVFRIFRSR